MYSIIDNKMPLHRSLSPRDVERDQRAVVVVATSSWGRKSRRSQCTPRYRPAKGRCITNHYGYGTKDSILNRDRIVYTCTTSAFKAIREVLLVELTHGKHRQTRGDWTAFAPIFTNRRVAILLLCRRCSNKRKKGGVIGTHMRALV